MKKIRTLLCSGLLLTAAVALAQTTETTEGIIIEADGVQHQFAISQVCEITFSDNGMTLIQTDDVTVEFPWQWQLRFGQVETDGISIVDFTDSNAVAQVYNVEGKMVKQVPMSELRISDLPKGVYIISCNGKSLKVLR